MSRKQKRLIVIFGALSLLAIAMGLVLVALSQEIHYFRMPSDLTAADMISHARFRLGGVIEKGSVIHGIGGQVQFTVTDKMKSIKVTYNGILPDLFREEQGVVTEGHFEPNGTFVADNVLAKHDEKYMPKDVADSLKAKGMWQGK